MYDKYEAFIREYRDGYGTFYIVRCQRGDLFETLYSNGLLDHGGSIDAPRKGSCFDTKLAAFDSLVWLRDFLERCEQVKKLDAEIF